jgi:hypothetical protein
VLHLFSDTGLRLGGILLIALGLCLSIKLVKENGQKKEDDADQKRTYKQGSTHDSALPFAALGTLVSSRRFLF